VVSLNRNLVGYKKYLVVIIIIIIILNAEIIVTLSRKRMLQGTVKINLIVTFCINIVHHAIAVAVVFVSYCSYN